MLGAVQLGMDPGEERAVARTAPTMATLCAAFLEGHGPKLKPNTRTDYASAFAKHILPAVGHIMAESVTAADLNQVHVNLADRPYRANRVIAYVGSAFSWGARHGLIPRDHNPARDVTKFREQGRERYLTGEELGQLGAALR